MNEKYNMPMSPDSDKEAVPRAYPSHAGLQVVPETLATTQEPQYVQSPVWDAFGRSETIQESVKETTKPEATYCGLRRSTFILSLILVIVVVVAAVGGGVGGAMAVQHARNNREQAASAATTSAAPTTAVATTPVSTSEITPAATSEAASSTSSSSTPSASDSPTSTSSSRIVAPTGTLALDCPNLTDEGQQLVTLGTTSWRFQPTCGRDYNKNDIFSIVSYSFSDCMRACASYNSHYSDDPCKAVTFVADMNRVVTKLYGNCFLKNGTSIVIDGQGDLWVAAALTSSG